VHKTVWRLREAKARRVALQLPEGLLMFALTLADILQTHTGARGVVFVVVVVVVWGGGVVCGGLFLGL
jgi:diphthamide biosynthesis enzyme Dph1/Dph2-like protein